jgi:hypothetical protein
MVIKNGSTAVGISHSACGRAITSRLSPLSLSSSASHSGRSSSSEPRSGITPIRMRAASSPASNMMNGSASG